MSTPAPSATRARQWAWLPTCVLSTILFEAARVTLVATHNEALVPTLLLAGALAMPATFVTFVSGRGLKATVGAATIALTGLAGGVIGVVVAGLIEFDTLNGFGLPAKVGVAVIEELAKLLVPAGLLVVGRARGGADGLILGVAAGAGFATLETMGYAFTTIVNSHGDLTEVSHLLLVRGFWSPGGHMAWTGLTVWALYSAAERRFSPRTWGVQAAAAAAAIGLHTAWDGLQTGWAYVLIALLGLATLATAVHRELNEDGRTAPEVGIEWSCLVGLAQATDNGRHHKAGLRPPSLMVEHDPHHPGDGGQSSA